MTVAGILTALIPIAEQIIEAWRKHSDDEVTQFTAAIAMATVTITDWAATEPISIGLHSFELRARGECNIQLAPLGYDGDHLPTAIYGAREAAVFGARAAFEKRGAR